jgi:hypothetical protein
MKVIFETSMGNMSETAFTFCGDRIMDLSVMPNILSDQCNPYKTGSTGKVVYVSDEEYLTVQKALENK